MRQIPQLGSRRLLLCSTLLFALTGAASALLYWGAVSLLLRWGMGPLSYAVGLLAPLITGGGIALLLGIRFARRFSKLQSAFQTIADGDLSVRLPEQGCGTFSATYAQFNRMAQELQEVRSRRDTYVNTLTHEFKTPLTAIRGFAELLQEPGFSESEQKKYLRVIADVSKQLADLASDALLLTKLESDRQLPVVQSVFWLDEQVSRCLTLLQGSAQEKGQTLRADLEPIECRGSEELLSHVWINLISNAVKYTPQGGQITVTLAKAGAEAVCTVSDTGIGMTEEVRQHIFDRYYQADPSHTGKGIGLGLPIVRNIVSRCGGRIEVESTPGVGSTFRVILPDGLEGPGQSSPSGAPLPEDAPAP